MSWRKYFKSNTSGSLSPLSGRVLPDSKGDFKFQNYGSLLPEVYMGHPNRLERYNQYESMDMDSEINSALDIVAEFSTQQNTENLTPFKIEFHDKPTETEVKILDRQLRDWCKLNQFDRRMFKMFRNVIKYGDQVFLRDPETFKLLWIDMVNVTKVIVNESDGKRPEQYVLRDVNPNFESLSVTQVTADNFYHTNPNTTGYGAAAYQMPTNPYSGNSRFVHSMRETTFDAKHILHLSLNEGLDANWPFGNSILENIFKVFKQKELLEDAIIIYRVQRAPERRIFYIDVGNMPSHMAMAFVERVKNEIHQRRIPTQSGGGNFMDSTYNPLCLDLSTRIPLLDGRTLELSQLIQEFQAGKTNWAYSCDPQTGKVVPGVINWAGLTRQNAEVIKLTFDNGESLICTPDHKIPVWGRGFVEAQELTPQDNLIAFVKDSDKVWDHEENIWKTSQEITQSLNKESQPVINSDKLFNCVVISVEKLESRDVGTITIDGREEYHGYHTFAIESGVFIKNSINEDYYFPQSCLSLDTSIKLLDGRDLTLNQIIQEHKENKENFVYTVNQTTLEIEPGKIVWADVTRKNTQVVEVLLDNGEKVICTPDHRFIMRDGSETEAQHLIKDQSVMSFDTTASLPAERIDYKVVSVKWVTDTIDTGDITIESANNNHNFALSSGVFVHNSEGRGSKVETLPGGCLAMDTEVLLLDGRTLSISQIANEYQQGIENWTHSCDPATGKIVPGVISWAGVTQESAQVMKITLDNGESIVCTLDHKFPVPEKGIIQAKDLEIAQSLFPVQGISNIKITNIEFLSESIQVGTLTIDVDEKYHDYHNFALACGVFTQNSNLGEIDDLRFFTNKLFRGLRIPSSYLPTGAEDSERAFTDGKATTALIQEHRFNQYCMRLQSLMTAPLNQEFKAFLKWRGFNLDNTLFDIKLTEPQNFAKYRQVALDTDKIQSFTSLESLPYMSKRFLMSRYLGLSEEELMENAKLWREENLSPEAAVTEKAVLGDIGITPSGVESDLTALEAPETPETPEATPAVGGEETPELV